MIKPRLNPFARALLALALPGTAFATPTGGEVVSGDITITNPDPTTTQVDQGSHTGIINWQGFSVGSDEWVLFNLPNSSASILNRVVGGNPSEILGHIQSNGRVFLLNPNGVLFGAGATVDVGSLFASTFNISDSDFLAGHYTFVGDGSQAGVENAGSIHVADGGFAVLSAEQVRNSGLIQARLGNVELASGSSLTMDLDGNGLINLEVTGDALSQMAGVSNVGEILADGGRVAMTARVARQLAGTVVNNTGLIRAGGITEDAGGIVLTASGGDIVQDGTLDVSASAGHDAGSVSIAGDGDVTLTGNSQILATGDSGGNVRAYAGGTLTFAQGAAIDVARQSADGAGGQAELSGAGHVRIRSTDVNLGDYGRLVIDPTDLVIGEDDSADLLVSDLETMLQTGASTATIDIVASNSIFVLDIADDEINGQTAAGGTGASLLLGIGFEDGGFFRGTDGSIDFQSSGDSILVDGGISIYSGSNSGSINVGSLTGGGNIVVEGANNVTVGNVTTSLTAGAIDIASLGGSVTSGDLRGLSVAVDAGNGVADVGFVRAGTGGATITSENTDTSDDGSGLIGGVFVDGVTSDGGVTLTASDADNKGAGLGVTSTAAIKGQGAISIGADSGNVSVVDVKTDTSGTVNTASIDIGAVKGTVSTGNLDALAGVGGASVNVSALGDLTVEGHASVEGGGGSGTPESDYIASLVLSSGGAVQVNGNVTVTGNSVSSFVEGDTFSRSSDEGSALFQVQGTSISLLGDVDVTGVGDAIGLLQSSGDITITGTTTLASSIASIDTTSFSGTGTTTVSRGGQAQLVLFDTSGAGTVSTGDIHITGPNASILALGGLLRIGAGSASGPNPDALTVTALDSGGEGGTFYSVSENDTTVVTSTLGIADVSLQAIGDGDSSNTALILNGNLRVSGPLAGAKLVSQNGITIGGGAFVTGTGFQIDGDFSRLPNEQAIDALGLPIPSLDNGFVSWGAANLELTSAAGFVSVDGITVEGIGLAHVSVLTESAGLGDVAITANDGEVEGSYTRFENIGGDTYSVTHRIDNGTNGGHARYGSAEFDLGFTGTSASLDSLTMAGLSNQAGILGTGAVTIAGGITLTGAAAGNAPTVRERVSYQAVDGGTAPAIANTTTTFTGGLNVFGVGVAGQAPSSFTSGAIHISGAGITGLAIVAGSTNTGLIDLSATAGSLTSNDWVHNSGIGQGQTVRDTLGDVLVSLGTAGSQANIGKLTVGASGDVFLGVQAVSSGAVSITAGGALLGVAPDELISLANPIDATIPDEPAGGRTGGGTQRLGTKADQVLQATSLTGTTVTVNFSEDSELDDLSLTARNGAVTLDGHGAVLSIDGGAGALALSGRTATIANATIAADTLAVTASGAVVPSGATLLLSGVNYGGTGLTLTAANGNVSVADSNIAVDSVTIGSGGATSITDTFLGGDLALTSGGAVTVDDTSLEGDLGTITAAGNIGITGLSLILYGDSFDATSTGGGISVQDSSIGVTGTRALGTGNVTLDAALDVLISDAGIQGGDVTLTGRNVQLRNNSVIGATNLLLIAKNGAVDDGGQDFTIDAASLGVSATTQISLTAGHMNVGTGQTTLGGDAALIAELIRRGLPVPDTTSPNASFLAPTVGIAGLTLAGDYLFLQGNTVTAAFFAPNDLTLQFVPDSPTATLGLENAPANNEDVNVNVQQNFPGLSSPTVIIGSTSYNGDIFVGEDGAVIPPPGTDLVLVTNGNIHTPSKIQSTGTVTTIGTVIEEPPPEVTPPNDEVIAVQNDPTPTGTPDVPTLPPPGTEDDLIDQTTDTGPTLVCQ